MLEQNKDQRFHGRWEPLTTLMRRNLMSMGDAVCAAVMVVVCALRIAGCDPAIEFMVAAAAR